MATIRITIGEDRRELVADALDEGICVLRNNLHNPNLNEEELAELEEECEWLERFRRRVLTQPIAGRKK